MFAGRNSAAVTVSLEAQDQYAFPGGELGGISTNSRQSPRTSRPPLAPAETAGRREADRDGPQRQRRRLRDDRRPLPGPPARLLPPDAGLDRGRRRRPAGGLRQRLPGDARRRARDQPAPLALPDRPQPLPQPPAQTDRRRAGIDGHGARRRSLPRPPRRSTTARSSARSSATSTNFPRPSARRCCCARWTRSPTRRSPPRWRPRCPRSSRCWCGRGSRSPRRARPAC